MVTRLQHAVSTQVNKVPSTALLENGMDITFLFLTGVSFGHQEKNNQKIMSLTVFRLAGGCRIFVWWPFLLVHAGNRENLGRIVFQLIAPSVISSSPVQC